MNNSIHNLFSKINQELESNTENDLFMGSYDNFPYIYDSDDFFAMNRNDLYNGDNIIINSISEDNNNEKYEQSSDKEISIVIDKNENSNLMNNTNDNVKMKILIL